MRATGSCTLRASSSAPRTACGVAGPAVVVVAAVSICTTRWPWRSSMRSDSPSSPAVPVLAAPRMGYAGKVTNSSGALAAATPARAIGTGWPAPLKRRTSA